MTRSYEYRNDIDGLRAVAVLGVLLFHAKLSWIPGGFVGVDVFFVISGFLITRIILGHDGSIGSFLLHFYERRVRRLAPPAIPVLLFTIAYAWYLLPPAALVEFSQSLVAFTAFVSNWFFWLNVGYFDGPAQFKPLLHTWSLSIEEQFYLLFPIPILLARRHGASAVGMLLAAVFVLSLAYSSYLIWAQQADAAFYNSFARFWEIALGGLIAAGIIKQPKSVEARQVLGIVGFAAIAISMLTFGRIPFPGLSALVPTIGAASLILARDSLANRMLAFRPVVTIGLISYALYLWHWPIFVFIEYAVIGASAWHFVVGMLISFVLATASYFLVEMPVRERRAFCSSTAISSAFAASVALFAGIGAAAWKADGVPSRFPAAEEYAEVILASVLGQAKATLRNVCWVGGDVEMQPVFERCVHIARDKKNVLLSGDSHAAQFYPAFAAEWPNVSISLLASNSCTLRPGERRACNELVNWLDAKSAEGTLPYDHVILTARTTTNEIAEDLSAFALKLAGRGVPVTVLGPIQFYKPDLPTMFPTMAGTYSRDQMAQAFTQAVQPDQFKVDALFRERLIGTAVQYISLIQVTCPTGPHSCKHFGSDGMPVTIDNSHLSLEEARRVVAQVASKIIPRR